MGKLLSRDDILNAQDLPTERVYVDPWGGEVLVRGLTAAERDEYEASIVRRKGQKTEVDMRNIRAKLVVRCVVDENGQRVFRDEDAELLGQKSAAAVDRIFEVAQRLSGLSNRDIEELAGN